MPKLLIRRLSAVVLIGFLGGCSIIGQPVRKAEKPKGPPPPAAEELYARAACHPDPAQGMAMARALLAGDPDNVATQLLHAYQIERTGRPVQAWEIYTSLAQGTYLQSTSLTCEGVLVYGGSVSDIAKFRSDWLAQTLRAQGVQLTPEQAVAKDLASPQPDIKAQPVILPPPFAEPKPVGMPVAAPATPVAEEVSRPPTAPLPATGVFAHLASYKGPKALDRGWRALSSRFEAQLGSYQKAMQTVTLDAGKGTVLRLGVRTPDRATALSLCRALQAKRQYCRVLK